MTSKLTIHRTVPKNPSLPSHVTYNFFKSKHSGEIIFNSLFNSVS